MFRAFAALVRRSMVACLLLVALVSVLEVGMWIYEFSPLRPRTADATSLSVLPSRVTMYELPEFQTLVSNKSGEDSSVRIRINSFGLRGEEVTVPKPPKRFRVLCLGDESPLGPFVAEKQTWPSELQLRLQTRSEVEIEVLNAGLPHSCPLNALVRLKQRLAALDPDLILLHVDPSDAADDRLQRPYLRLDQQGAPVAIVHPSFEFERNSFERLSRQFRTIAWLKQKTIRQLGLEPEWNDSQPDISTALMLWSQSLEAASVVEAGFPLSPVPRIKQLADTMSADLVLCSCPNAWQLAGLLKNSGASRDLLLAPSAALQRLSEETGIPVIDVTSNFERYNNPRELFVSGGAGLSPRGCAFYAEQIAQALLTPATGGAAP